MVSCRDSILFLNLKRRRPVEIEALEYEMWEQFPFNFLIPWLVCREKTPVCYLWLVLYVDHASNPKSSISIQSEELPL